MNVFHGVQRYKGQLQFEDDNLVIQVHRFIVRGEKGEISFEMETMWPGFGLVKIDDRAAIYNDTFRTGKIFAKDRLGNILRNDLEILIGITEENEPWIKITGVWIEDGSRYNFSGDLDLDL